MTTFEGSIGTWWVEGDEDRHFSGYVELVAEDAEPWKLVLDGAPDTDPYEPFSSGLRFHGLTGVGPLTLQNAHLRSGTSHHRGCVNQTWHGTVLTKRSHLGEGQRFDGAAFKLPDLIRWVGPTRANVHNRPAVELRAGVESLPRFESTLDDGTVVTLLVGEMTRHGVITDSREVLAWYRLTHDDGLDESRVEQVELALTRLHAILMSRTVRAHELEFWWDDADGATRTVEVIDRSERPEPEQRPHDPLVDTSDIDFDNFIRRWVRLHDKAVAAVASAAPNLHTGYLSTEIIDACTALEHLAVGVMPEPVLTDAEARALEALETAGVGSKLRKRAERAYLQGHQSFEAKLIAVAETLGEESARWILGDNLKYWAHCVMRLRNSLVHGGPLPDGMTDDVPFSVAVLRTVRTVLRFGLLVEAGYANRAAGEPAELFRRDGASTIGHPSAEYIWELNWLSDVSGYWSGWYGRIR